MCQITKKIHNCPVLFVNNLGGGIYLMRMQCPAIAQTAQPGQFINIKVNDEFIPLLRKPFSICRRSREDGWIEILWKTVGKGTEILSKYEPGDQANILGPLGRGFSIPPAIKTASLVGGGIGVAPLPFLCNELLDKGLSVDVYIGAKSANELTFISEFQARGVEVYIATEDGSKGKRGLVTNVLLERIRQNQTTRLGYIYSCGPPGFLKCMMDITKNLNIEGQISIESMMGCGFGICMGCPVKVRDDEARDAHYKLTCIDGPVFNAWEVELDD